VPPSISYYPHLRDADAAKRLFRNALSDRSHPQPRVINTDLAPIYGSAIADMKKEGTLRSRCHHRPVQYLNNIIEQDHRAIKRRVHAKQGFREFRTDLPARSVLRSNGVMVVLVHIPCKSGWPSAVRGKVPAFVFVRADSFVARVAVWPTRGRTITIDETAKDRNSRMFIEILYTLSHAARLMASVLLSQTDEKLSS